MLQVYKNHLSSECISLPLDEVRRRAEELPEWTEDFKSRLNDRDFEWVVVSGFVGGSPNRRINTSNPASKMTALILDFDFKELPSMAAKSTAEIEAQFRKRHSRKPHYLPTALSRTRTGGVRAYYIFERPIPVCVDERVTERFLLTLMRKLVGVGERCVLPGLDDPLVTRLNQLYDAGKGWVVLGSQTPAGLVEGVMHDALSKPERKRQEVRIPLEKLREWHEEFFPDAGIDWKSMNTDGWRPGKRYWDDNADSDSVLLYPEGAVCFTGDRGFVPWCDMFPDGRVERYGSDLVADATEHIYFEGNSRYYVPDAYSARGWLGVGEGSVRRRLTAAGLSNEGGQNSEVSRGLGMIEDLRTITGCFPFLYRPEAVVHYQGNRYLNVASAKPMVPEADHGAWGEKFPNIATLLDNFWLGDEKNQKAYFLGWLRHAYSAALEGRAVRGQAIFLAGGRGAGKNFLTEGCLSPIFGGHANGEDFLTGRDNFSANIFNKGLVLINDPEPPTTRAAKQKFTSMLKKHVANETVIYRAMYSNPVALPWQGRFVITINDNPAALESLPEVSQDLIDKLMFFRVQAPPQWKDRLYPSDDTIRAELPFFLGWLLAHEPDCKSNARFGVESYHHHDIMREASSLTVSSQIAGYVADYLRSTGQTGASEQELSGLFEAIAESSPRSFTKLCPTRKILDRALSESMNDATVDWVVARVNPQNVTRWRFDLRLL